MRKIFKEVLKYLYEAIVKDKGDTKEAKKQMEIIINSIALDPNRFFEEAREEMRNFE